MRDHIIERINEIKTKSTLLKEKKDKLIRLSKVNNDKSYLLPVKGIDFQLFQLSKVLVTNEVILNKIDGRKSYVH